MAMTEQHEADLFAELMNFVEKTPQQLLADLLTREGLRRVDLGKMLGLSNPSNQVTNMLDPKQPQRFGPRRQRSVARLFNLPDDYFRSATLQAKLDAYRGKIWQEFLGGKVAAMTNDDQRALVKWVCDSIPLRKPYLGASFLEAVALALMDPRRYTEEELDAAVAENAALDEKLERIKNTPPAHQPKQSRAKKKARSRK